jgi:hypothetical protein
MHCQLNNDLLYEHHYILRVSVNRNYNFLKLLFVLMLLCT